MARNDDDRNLKDIDMVEELKTLDDYDKKLEDMEAQIKELKKIKRRRKKMMELESERDDIIKKINKVDKTKHR
ncbi:MAG: hypothetical protein E6344_18795 [Clostridium sp.]|uniref:hypothetical protein n=1 Tax=Clostridium culturomicium TaxID=1499683 RepID=UPI00058DB991|nr:hypothetical protein [Clostridium culturomicium]MDU4892372.1 hypothetical protein [Clostridium sp.]MDU7085746.1 hypothetical protein [Clostridium sp.]